MLANANNCTGCGACGAVCPTQAITLCKDSNGFRYPTVDKELCVNCMRCQKVCPCLKDTVASSELSLWAIRNKDEEVLHSSSSGGLFSLLAMVYLRNGGVVCGCAMDDDCKGGSHIIIESADALSRLRGSKYIESSVGDCLATVKKFLDAGRHTLFCGTPCQIAGLKSYLNRQYDQLLTVDFICHGVSSPAVWKRYVETVEQEQNKMAVSASFRDKTIGWHSFSVKLAFSDGSTFTKKLSESLFMRGYLENLFLRNSCYSCRFKGDNYYSDLTMADFWGIDEFFPELDDNKGYSLGVAHTQNGQKILEQIQPYADMMELTHSQAFKRNQSYYHKATGNLFRNRALKEFKHMPFAQVIEKYCGLSLAAKVRRKLSRVYTTMRRKAQ